MREGSQLTHESLTHHSACQPTVAACAGDGTCGRYLLHSNASAIHAPTPLSCSVSWQVVIDSAPACAYVAGTLALILSQADQTNTP